MLGKPNTLEHSVGMAQVVLLRKPELARTVLGSCVGLVLYHEATGAAAIAHVVLPDGKDREGPPGKFADTAVPHMLDLLEQAGIPRRGLKAKAAGGASMFQSSGPIQIGESNQEAVRSVLKRFGIPLVAEHLGGIKGRRITYTPATSELLVEVAGQEAARL